MKVKDVIQLERNNENASRIILVRDGMFWRAYEYSAMRFQKKIAPSFLVQARHFKNENVTLCYLGFPINNLKAILQKAGYDLGVYNPQSQDREHPCLFVSFRNLPDFSLPFLSFLLG